MRFRIPNTFCLLSLLVLGFLSCKKDISIVTRPLNLPPGSNAVIDASNQFAFKFFNTVLQQDPALNNKLVSPLSVYTALSMVYNGAANATRDSIARVLQLNGIPIEDLNALSKALIQQMPKEDSRVTMDIANSIWYNRNGLIPIPAFLNTIQNDYNGQTRSLDFGSPSAAPTINSWIAQNTNNKIQNVLDNTDPFDQMYLVNAIYFNGTWKYGFKPENTRGGDFGRPGGNVNVPYMSAQMTVRVAHDPSFTLVELPYGGGNSYDMYLALPNDKDQSIKDFAASLDATKLTNTLSGLASERIGLNLPKWEYAYSIDDMKPNLAEMGMGIAFGYDADFANMYSVPPGTLYISRAIHKTYIKVSEQGTEASAATVVGVTLTAVPAIPLISFDHPFVYILRERQTGLILFIGIVTDPS